MIAPLRPRHVAPFALALWAAAALSVTAQVQLPEGFTPIFNGRNLDGWHMSRTTHHGTVGNFHVENGVLLASQRPFGQGGLLLTDKVYKDFELYLELKPDPGFNSGVFLRSSESGSAYQIEINTPGDATANFIGERLRLSQPKYLGEKIPVSKVWKDDDWNSMRIRMVGEAPRVTTWVNGTELYSLEMPKNDQVGGIYGGMIGLQLHYSSSFTPAAQSGGWSGISTRPWQLQRFRNIGIKEIQ